MNKFFSLFVVLFSVLSFFFSKEVERFINYNFIIRNGI